MMTPITSNSTHGHVRWFSPVEYCGHTVLIEDVPDDPDWRYCQEHGHRLGPLDHYDVPTGQLLCYHCGAVADDPTYVRDVKREAYLMWKHWGWQSVGTPRRMRLRYWCHDLLSRIAIRLKGRR